jgi:hypothetical protein
MRAEDAPKGRSPVRISTSRHLQFRPHGDNLLTPSAAFWLASVRVLVFTMASAEALSWGYLGYLFGDNGLTRWIGAAFTGLTMFIVVWMVDLSLVTLDRARGEHSKSILGDSDESSGARRTREVVTLALRIGLLLGSLSITAPYLAQIVFHRDIDQFTSSEAAAAIQAGREKLTARYDAELKSKDADLSEKRKEYEAETAGKGRSGRYGEGPAAAALRSDIREIEAERNVVSHEKDETLQKFNRLSANWQENRDQLASSYDIVLPKTSILQNRKALEELRKRPENTQTELAIKAFLAIIFCGLLLLKIFEPASVHLYMSDILQDAYISYMGGLYDKALPDAEKSTNPVSKISPQRFYSFLTTTWVPMQKTAAQQRKDAEKERLREEERREWEFAEERGKAEGERQSRGRQRQWAEDERGIERQRWIRQQEMEESLKATERRIRAAKEALQSLQAQRAAALLEEQACRDVYVQARDRADSAVNLYSDIEETIRTVQRDIDFFDRELQSYDLGLRGLDESSRAEIAAIKTKVRQRRKDANISLTNLTAKLIEVKTRQQSALADQAEADQKVKKAAARINQVQIKIDDVEYQIAAWALQTGNSAVLGVVSAEARTEISPELPDPSHFQLPTIGSSTEPSEENGAHLSIAPSAHETAITTGTEPALAPPSKTDFGSGVAST